MAKELQIEDIYNLIDRFETSGLSELEVSLGDSRVRVKKGYAGAEAVAAPVVNAVTASAQPAVETVSSDASGAVRAHVVGSFYRAPSPESEPFVKVGDKVKKGDVLAIIEAMKVMNEVTAPEDGVITSIEVEDGNLVEFDQILMKMDPA